MARTKTSFKAGQSGNPGGRHKIPVEVMALLRENTEAALKKLWEICLDDSDRRVQLTALMNWLDRSIGKPKEQPETNPADAPDDLVVEKAREALRVIDGGKKS